VGDVSRTYAYNAQGNLEQVIDRNGRKMVYAYDRLDRRLFEDWLDPGYAAVYQLVTEYDALGRVTLSAGSDFTTLDVAIQSFDYDHLGRLTVERNFDPTGTVISPVPRVEQLYQYDVLALNDNLIRTIYSQYLVDEMGVEELIGSGRIFTDPRGRTAKIVDNANQVSGITAKTINFTYDASDQLTAITRTANGGAFRFDTTYDYDQAGRVTVVEHRRPTVSGTPFTACLFGYDRANRSGMFNLAPQRSRPSSAAVRSRRSLPRDEWQSPPNNGRNRTC
jgi:YD repeat-containing protein